MVGEVLPTDVSVPSGVSTVAGAVVVGALLGGSLAAVALPRLLTQADAMPRRGLVGLCAGTAGLAVSILALRFARIELLAFGFLAGTGVVAAAIDVVEQRLPRQLVVPSVGVLGGLLTVEATAAGRWGNLVTALAAAAAVALAYLLVALASNGGLGSGDVTFGALLGMAMGWQGWATVVTGTAVAWVGAAAALLVLRCLGRRPHAIPMGPFLLGGALVALLSG